MRWSQLFGKSTREDPGEADVISHRLMIRAGMIHQSASGVYSYLPLAWRSLRKIEQIIRDEMDAIGGQEMRMSVLQPRELWDQSGRTDAYGPELFQLQDRRDRPMVLAPTHEELLTTIVNHHVQSYRNLPIILYQIQTKFRDEPRPRGGLIRVREFDMKDAYSFDIDEKGLNCSYQAMVKAYQNIYRRCGLDAVMVQADSGAIGGTDSNEFVLLADAGEDTIVFCRKCNYAANAETAVFVKAPGLEEDLLPLQEIHTPGVKTIQDLSNFLGIPINKTLKAVLYVADGELTSVTIRGDLIVNETKLSNAIGANELRLANPEEIKTAGLLAGSTSALGLEELRKVSDDSVNLGCNFVAGANKFEYHARNTNYPRDFKFDVIADIAMAQDGDMCPRCPSFLTTSRGIEVGHVFKLGTRYSEVLNTNFLDREGNQQTFIMGCYGIGLGRLLGAAIEQHHDESGIMFPLPIAPYQVTLIGLNLQDESVVTAAELLYSELIESGLEVLYDDRMESAGIKFNDADLLGLPLRVVVSPRNMKQGIVEMKLRSSVDSINVSNSIAVTKVKELLNSAGSSAI